LTLSSAFSCKGLTWRSQYITSQETARIIFALNAPCNGLIFSQILLSIQLPWTIFLQIHLTSSKKLMGKYANDRLGRVLLWSVAATVVALNLMLLWSYL
jgi:manganese transport protein